MDVHLLIYNGEHVRHSIQWLHFLMPTSLNYLSDHTLITAMYTLHPQKRQTGSRTALRSFIPSRSTSDLLDISVLEETGFIKLKPN